MREHSLFNSFLITIIPLYNINILLQLFFITYKLKVPILPTNIIIVRFTTIIFNAFNPNYLATIRNEAWN